MEVTLKYRREDLTGQKYGSFNPCYSGSNSKILTNPVAQKQFDMCFNPCYSGSNSKIYTDEQTARAELLFQSLL